MNLTHFTFDVDNHGVATLLMDVQGEKVNTLSPKVEEDLHQVLSKVESDPAIRALVIGSAKKNNFIAGADIRTIKSVDTAAKATELATDLQKGFARLEALFTDAGKPVVAAIHGSCLGGGLELALACSMRIVSDSPKTKLGLPEVMLGLFPGAGGTQRLPRLIGVANALDLILTGKNVRPSKAVRLGLADEMVPPAIVLDIARKRALDTADGRVKPPKRGLARLKELASDVTDPEFLQQLALEENPVGLRVLFKKARDKLLETTRGNYPAPEKALEVIRIGMQEGLAAGYAAEADRFGQLVVTPQARSLMGIYFAEQELKKDKGVANPDVEIREVKKVGVLGGGLMGGGIATINITKAGVPSRIREIDDAGVARGLSYVRKVLDKDRKRRRRTSREVDRLMSMVTGSTSLAGFQNAEVIIEAVFEDLALKRRVLKEVEDNTPSNVIFASNTSSLPITDIAAQAKRPENVIGMHYFSPVEKMPLLEVITTKKTADWVTATCVALGKAQGKTVIVVNDGTGFYTSRILGPYMNEAAWLLSEEAGIGDLDEALMDWGFPVGPITLLDEVGIDVAGKVAGIMEKAFGERMEAPGTIDVLLKDDRKGRKNGRGFFLYDNGKKGAPDTSVYGVLGQTDKRKRFEAEEMQQRLGLQMVAEAARCLEEGILRSPRDGDIGAIFGLGFPPFTGGPFAWVDQTGCEEVVRRMNRYAERHGARFTPPQILQDYAKSGSRFRPELG